MFKKFFIFVIVMLLFIDVDNVFSEDKNLTDSENFHIKVIVKNEKIPKEEKVTDKDLDLKDGDNIDLTDEDEEFSVVTKKTDSTVNISEYEKVLDAYKKWNFKIFLESNFENINAGDGLPVDIKISTISQKEIDLSEYIVDAYIIIRDKYGNIIGKQDLWDITKNIDFLDLLNNGNINEVLSIYLKHNFFVSFIPGEYSVELTMVFLTEFLDLDKSITDKYQIEVKSNKLNIIKNSSEKCLVKDYKYDIDQYKLVYMLIIVLVILIGLMLMILINSLLYFFKKKNKI